MASSARDRGSASFPDFSASSTSSTQTIDALEGAGRGARRDAGEPPPVLQQTSQAQDLARVSWQAWSRESHDRQASSESTQRHDAVDGGRPNKRARTEVRDPQRKVNDARVAYPRRRALTACQLCRTRKSKCDNQRPRCGSCSSLNVRCIYQPSNTDISSFDKASLTILDRVNYAIQLIQTQSRLGADPAQLRSPPTIRPPAVQSPEPSLDEESPLGSITDDNPGRDELLGAPPKCSSLWVLKWPIFEGKYDEDQTLRHLSESNCINKPIADSPGGGDNPPALKPFDRSAIPGRGVHEEDVPALVQDFLTKVHGKNPMLEPSELLAMARRVALEGFEWNEASCLVALACGLATLSEPFAFEKVDGGLSHLDARDYGTAEKYYTIARKRIGLISTSFLSVQCAFLMGVYEMFTLRPLKGWLSFTNACNIFAAHIITKPVEAGGSPGLTRLERLLYWTCRKVECETRDELHFPASSLNKNDFPDFFPSPPGTDSTPGSTDLHIESPNSLGTASEQEWFYYLSEIAVLRLTKRISEAFYCCDARNWLNMPLRRMTTVADELDAQVMRWSEHVPFPMDLQDERVPDELTWVMRLRVIQLRERISRPFLFILLHDAARYAGEPTVTTYSRRCLEYSLLGLHYLGIKRRHQGTWLGAKTIFTWSLVMLAAAKSGKIALPEHWRGAVDHALAYMKYWSAESPDLKTARLILQKILEVDVR